MTSKTRSSKTAETDSTTKRTPSGTSVNRVTLVGRLVTNPELRSTANGIHVTTIRVVTNDREQPEFHDVVLWRQMADFATKYLAKGRLAFIEGRLQSHTWEAADGGERRTVEVIADRFQALSPKQAAEAAA